MRVLDLVIKDLRQIARDRQSFLFLLIMPVAFTLLFGFAFGGNTTADPRLPIGLLDDDRSELSQHLVAKLERSQVVRIEESETTASELEEQVAAEGIAAAVVIPAGFGAGLRLGEPRPIRLVAEGQAGFTVESEVQTAVSRLFNAVLSARISTNLAEEQGLLENDGDRSVHFDEAFSRVLAAWESPPAAVTNTSSAALADEVADDSNYSVYAHSSPGMMAQFAIAALIGAASIVVVEKKTHSLHRLLTTNMTRLQILFGHYLAMFCMIFLQLAVLILFGQLVLSLPYFSQPLATLLVTITAAMFAASLGLLIGALAKSEEQVVVYSLVPMFVLAGLGGAWVPLEVTPEAFQTAATFTPVAWIMDGYKDVLVRGLGVESVMTAASVLLAYALVLFGLAVWRFRVD